MKIAVCVSHVPDTASRIVIGGDGNSINPSGIQWIINPYDEFAVEEALQQKEKLGAAEAIAISAGGDASKETIRKALAMGADRGILLKHEGYLDASALSAILAEAIREEGCELVFFGKQSVDYDNSITGQLTAARLGWPAVSVVVDLTVEDQKVTAVREIEGGKEVVATSLPCIITAQKGLNEPRYASLKGIMKAKKKTIDEKNIDLVKPMTKQTSLDLPLGKQAGRILGDDASAVPELVRLLKEEAKVI